MTVKILSSLRVLMFLTAAATLLAGAPPVEAEISRPYREDELERFVEQEVITTDESVTRVRVRFVPPEPHRLPTRYRHSVILAGPPGATLNAKVENLRIALVADGGTVLNEYEGNRLTDYNDLTITELENLRVQQVDIFRSVAIYRAEMSVLVAVNLPREQGSPSGRGQVFTREMEVEFRFDRTVPEADREDLGRRDPYLLEMLEPIVLNPAQIPLVAERPELPADGDLAAWNRMLEEAAERGPILKAKVPGAGLYEIRPSIIRAAGVDPDSLEIDRVRAYVHGREVPLLFSRTTSRLFSGDVTAMVYVPEPSGLPTPYQALWLVVGQEGSEPLREELATIPGAPPREPDAVAMRTIEIFEPNIYHHLINLRAPQRRWATAEVPAGSSMDFEFELPEAAPDSAGRVMIWSTTVDGRRRYEYEAYLNGKLIGETPPRRGTIDTLTFQFETELLREGTNVLTLHNPERSGAPGAMMFLQAQVRAPVLAKGVPPNEEASLQSDGPTSSTLAFEFPPGFARSGVLADISDPFAPRFFPMGMTRIGEEDFLQVRAEFPGGAPQIVYSAFGYARPVPSFSRVEAPRLYGETSPVDYIIIAPPQLMEATAPLRDYRARDQIVELVSTDEIYDAFATGNKSDKAIHDFLRHAFHNRTGPRLRRVLLVGEGSEYWWEETRNRDDVTQNLVPVYGWRSPNQDIRGDEGYAKVAGPGPIPDIEIGRISAETPQEVAIVLEKIRTYEESPPAGTWMTRHAFVLDDEPEFLRVATNIVNEAFAGANIPIFYPLQEFPYENYFRGIWRKRSVLMTDTIVEAMNRGARTVTYLGHGGPNLWSGERIFHIRDIDRIESNGRYPVLLAGSCDTGWVDYPVEPVRKSLSENFLLRENGGVIAAYIPVAATNSYEHDFLLSGFYRALNKHGFRGVGQLALQSKIDYFRFRTNQDVTEQFLLMGDPAVRIVEPEVATAVRATPDRFLSVTGGALTFEASFEGVQWGMATATLLDADNVVVREQRTRIRRGATAGRLEVPEYLAPGDYRLVVSGSNEAAGRHEVAVAPIKVLRTDVRLEWDKEAAIAEEGVVRPFTASFNVVNETELAIPGTTLEILHSYSGRTLARVPLDIPAKQTLRPRFERRLPPLIGSVTGRLLLPRSDEPPLVLAETTILLSRPEEFMRFFSFPPQAIEVVRSPDETSFRIPVVNLSDRVLETLYIQLYWLDPDEDRIALGPRQFIERLEPGARQDLEITAPVAFETGEEAFAVEVTDASQPVARPLQVDVFNLSIKNPSDLEILEDSFYIENDFVRAGNTVFFKVKVRNSGGFPVQNVEARLYLREPWIDGNLAPNAVPWAGNNRLEVLNPGEEHEFRLRWDPADTAAGEVTVYAAVTTNVDEFEENRANNTAALTVNMVEPPNLKITAEGITTSSDYAAPYETIRVSVPIANNSRRDFIREFRLSAYAHTFDGQRIRKVDHRFDALMAGEEASLDFHWIVQPGEHRLEIHLNEDREYLEQTHDDNVEMIDFIYIVDDSMYLTAEGVWDFAGFPAEGEFLNATRQPDGNLRTRQRSAYPAVNRYFQPPFLAEGRTGPLLAVDNLWGMGRGILSAEFTETVPSVRFRFPADPNSGTTIYDLGIDHIGNLEQDRNSGNFLFRVEDERDWTRHAPKGRGYEYLTRVQTRDNHLDISFAAPDFPARVLINRIELRPAIGVYTSPILRFQKAPRGRLLADVGDDGDSRVDFAVRFGSRVDRGDVEWGDWLAVEPGEALPAAPPGARYFQWRTRLFDGMSVRPTVRNVRIEAYPQSPDQVARTQRETAAVSP